MGKIYDVKVELVRKTKEQFESDRIALAATPDEGEDIGALIANMKAAILGQMTKNLVGSTITEKVEIKKSSNSKQAGSSIPEEKPLTTKEKENGNSDSTGDSSDSSGEESSKQEASQKSERKKSSKGDSQKASQKSDSEESSSEEASGEKASEEEVVAEPKKIRGKKTVNYDRELATHKDMLGEFLDKSVGKKWRSGVLLAKAAKISGALHKEGTPFLDGEGNVLESFTAEFLKRFEAE